MPGTPPTRFVYLGPEGTFAEQALRTIPAAERGTRTPARSVPEALDAVRAGDADAALVPLENSIGGAVGVTLDELAAGDPLVITREVVLPVEFVLAARAGVGAGRHRARSPPTRRRPPSAAAGCATTCPTRSWSTCSPTRRPRPSAAAGEYDAAICAPIGAAGHRLTVLAEKIADHARRGDPLRAGVPARPAAATDRRRRHVAGGLHRPRPGRRAAGGAHRAGGTRRQPDPHRVPADRRAARPVRVLPRLHRARGRGRLGEALQGLRRVCADVRFLGSYPRHRWTGAEGEKPVPAPAGLSDADFADAAAWLRNLRAGEFS